MKMKKIIALILAVITALSLAGCQKQYEVANYQGVSKDTTLSEFNKELFYRNDKQTDGADPFILDNRERDGYFYQYVTNGFLYCYRSKNLMDWEAVGNTLEIMYFGEDGKRTEESKVLDSDIWAPEVVYDDETQLYYMFFSGSPAEEKIEPGKGVLEQTKVPYELLFVATSKVPYEGYKLVNFKDPASCGAENVHDYNETPGKKDASGNYITAYPHYYAKYLFLDPAKNLEFSTKYNARNKSADFGGYTAGIDPHPFVDDDGTKYLFWVDSRNEDMISGVKMINWLQPDWSTAVDITHHLYYTCEDFHAAKEGKQVQLAAYEPNNISINEGPQVYKHDNGKYYLTYSMGSYTDSSYQVGQAVADSVLGPYRKLNSEENAVMLSGGTSGSQETSGSGHHTIVKLGDKLYNFYHRHNSVLIAGGARNGAIDEIKWITIKDKDGKDLDVMYTNGPTWTVQPRLEEFAEWKNIAEEAKVTASTKAKDVKSLTDGLLSIYKYGDTNFLDTYVKETKITEKTTFTLEFDKARKVRAVMVYDSKSEMTAFMKIDSIQLICEENGEEVIRYIDNLKLSPENYEVNEMDGSLYYIKPGASVYAEFDELNVKAVKVTIDVPEDQEEIGISEIRILGK